MKFRDIKRLVQSDTGLESIQDSLLPQGSFSQCLASEFLYTASLLFCFVWGLFWLCCVACGILISWPGMEPQTQQWKCRVDHWTTREFPTWLLGPRGLSFGEGNGTPLQYSCLENPMDRGAWWAIVHGVTKSRRRWSNFTLTFHFPALEKEMATHSSVLAWRTPGTAEPGGLPSMGSHRVRHDWSHLVVVVVVVGFSFGRERDGKRERREGGRETEEQSQCLAF